MGYNLAVLDYWTATYPFLDVSKCGGGFYPVVGTPDSYDNGGWPTLSVGCTMQRGLTLGMDNEYGFYPPGDYEIVTTDPDLYIIAPSVGTGVPTAASGLGRATFTVVDASHTWGDLIITFRVRNDHATLSRKLSNLRVNLISDAAALLAGDIFKTGYVAAHTPCKVIRIHDFQYTDNPDISWVEKFADLPGTRGGETMTTYINGYMPVSIGMKFVKAVEEAQGYEARPWINVPCGQKQFWFKSTTATSRIERIDNHGLNDGFAALTIPHNLVNGERVIFADVATGNPPGVAPLVVDTIYFVVNARTGANNDFQLALTSGGAPVLFTYGAANAGAPQNAYVRMMSLDVDPYNDMILPWLTACHTAWPACRPMIELGGENWNTGFPVWHWIMRVGSMLANGGAGFYQGGWAHAWLHLLAWKAATSLWGEGNFTMIHPGQGSYFAILSESFNYPDPLGVRRTGVTLKQQYIDALATSGWGPSDTIPAVVYSVGAYVGNSAYSEANYPTHGIGFSILGDTYTRFGSASVPDSFWDTRFDEEINGLRPVVASDISQARAVVPSIPLVFYECGQQIAYSGSTNAAAVGRNLITYYDTSAGGAMYQRLWEMFAEFDPYVTCHFEAVGGRFVNNGQFYAWNVVPANLVETPRSLYLKSV